MNPIATWIMSILGIVIVGTVVDLVLPEGRMNKYIKSIFACATILIIVLPLPNLIKNNFNVNDGELIKPDFVLDSDYIEYAEKVKMRYLAHGVEEELANEGYKNTKVEISGNFKNNVVTINLVKINISNLVIDENLQHINKYEQISKLVTKYLSIDKGVVVINE